MWLDLLDNYTEKNDLVYEPFSGSGTTLIACEQLGRRCRAVEIAPSYVAVALERWSQATGKTPELLEAGSPPD
jgi:DNA modification methylase